MAKKQLSFAEKAAKKKGKGLKTVKFIKSILSEKTGHWRFKEKMVHLDGGESLDNALKRQEDALHALDMKMPVFEDESEVTEAPETETATSDESEVTEAPETETATSDEADNEDESEVTEAPETETATSDEAEEIPSDSNDTSKEDSKTPEK